MNTLRTRQRGMSMPGVMAIMATALFVGTFAFKVGPHYFENLTINKIVSDKMADDSLQSAPKSKVLAALDRAYDMNNLHGMNAKDTVTLVKNKRGGGFTMLVKYEKRTSLFSNIDVVTRFEKEVTR